MKLSKRQISVKKNKKNCYSCTRKYFLYKFNKKMGELWQKIQF